MTDQNYRDIIAAGWLEMAEEAFEEARILLREKKPVGCVNRVAASRPVVAANVNLSFRLRSSIT